VAVQIWPLLSLFHFPLPCIHARNVTVAWSAVGRSAERGAMQCVIRNSIPLRNGINSFNLPWRGCSTHQPKPTPSLLSRSFALPGVRGPLTTSALRSTSSYRWRAFGSSQARLRPAHQVSSPNISVVFYRPYIQIPGHCLITSRHMSNAHVVTQTSRSRCSPVCLVITLTDTLWFDSRQEQGNFIFFGKPKIGSGTTQSPPFPNQFVPWARRWPLTFFWFRD